MSHFRRPPAPGSALKTRLVALGRAMAAYGQVAEARQCWEAAGQWSELFPLLVMQADFASLERFAQKVLLHSTVLPISATFALT